MPKLREAEPISTYVYIEGEKVSEKPKIFQIKEAQKKVLDWLKSQIEEEKK